MDKEIKIPKKRGSKPKFVVTPEVLKNVRKLSGQGLTQEMIHNYYGISKDTWYRYVGNHPELEKAVKEGKSKTISMVAGKLMELVRKGNLGAIIFYLKTQGRFSEHSTLKVEGDGKPVPPSLTLNVSDPIEAAKIYQQIMLGS